MRKYRVKYYGGRQYKWGRERGEKREQGVRGTGSETVCPAHNSIGVVVVYRAEREREREKRKMKSEKERNKKKQRNK